MAGATTGANDDKASARRLIEMVMGFRQTQLIHVAAKLGIADLLAHGPRSSRELAQATNVDERNLYRLLRGLEREGLVTSSWDVGAGGPARRVYQLTPAGTRLLKAWATALASTGQVIATFLARFDQKQRRRP